MTALQITSMKNFMSQLLISDTFDVFLLEEAVIGTANTFTIDGRINQEFFSGQEQESEVPALEFRPWNEIKGLCFDLIQGNTHHRNRLSYLCHVQRGRQYLGQSPEKIPGEKRHRL